MYWSGLSTLALMPVRGVLVIGLNWEFGIGWLAHTLEDADGSGEVVDTAGSLQGSAEDLNGGDEIVGEAVVQVALHRN